MMLFRVLFTYCFRGKSPEKLPFLLSSFGSAETRSQNYTRMYSFDRRADCVVYTVDSIYLFEFKLSGNGTAEDAIAQIKEKDYAAKYMADGKKIVLIGSSFDEKTRTIKDWKVANG